MTYIFAKATMVAAAIAVGGCTTMAPMSAQSTSGLSYVGGAAMYPTKTIVGNAVNSPDHTTLVAAVKAADLVDTLSGTGPFTVFAPTNAAFGKLPSGRVDTLLLAQNKPMLRSVLTYHVVPGRVTANELMAMIRTGGGRATLTTVQGAPLYASMMGSTVMLTDAKGNMGHVTQANVMQSNGVIHVIDTVMMP